jgi:hypothetical protein
MLGFFKKIKIVKIEFQSNTNEVSLMCEININEQTHKNEIIINYSQLNRLLGKIQQVTNLVDIYAKIIQTKMNDHTTFYSLEGNDFELDSVDFEGIAPIYELKQIKS